MLHQKRILVAPLNWGLGHASRCVPIIRELLALRAEVIVGADHVPLELLRKEFPDLEYIEFPGMEITYKSNSSLIMNMALQANKFYKTFSDEHAFLQKAIDNYAIDVVISDNRYGAYSNQIPSFLITHQVFLNLPFGKKVMNKFIKSQISNFNECWIPDFPGSSNLSGVLSHKKNLPENYHFIGPLSRFANEGKSEDLPIKRKLMIILSGPEPNRTELENLLLDQLKDIDFNVLMVRGIPNGDELDNPLPNVQIESVLTSDELYGEICSSEIVLSRSGYSTIMDMVALGKKAIFVPTKGQPEQEYLAAKFKNDRTFYSVEEMDLNLLEAIKESRDYKPLQIDYDNSLLINKLRKITAYSK